MRRAHRLRRPADFQRVRAKRRSWGHPLLVLYVAPNDGPTTRLGISVGKRVGKAVVRNGVKRRVREAVRHRLPELPSGQDLVFIARAPAADASWPALRDATEDLLRRARLLRRTATAPASDARSSRSAAPTRPADTATPATAQAADDGTSQAPDAQRTAITPQAPQHE